MHCSLHHVVETVDNHSVVPCWADRQQSLGADDLSLGGLRLAFVCLTTEDYSITIAKDNIFLSTHQLLAATGKVK